MGILQLAIDGNPLEDIRTIAVEHMDVIMKEGEFIKKYNIINLDRIDGSNEIIDNNIIYKIDNNFIFSYIYAEINGTEKVVIKSIREDFIYLIYKIIYLTEAILYIICIIYEIKYKRKNKKIK